MDASRFDRLSSRQAECLRLVAQLQSTKEIAAALNLSPKTVDGYIDAARTVIGARDRRDAAVQFAAYEAGPAGENRAAAAPGEFPGGFPRLVDAPPLPSIIAAPERMPAEERTVLMPRLPFRRKGQTGNDLSIAERLFWVPAIAIGLAIGFGMLAVGLQVLTEVIGRVVHLPS